jgi:DNA topoisomerase-3
MSDVKATVESLSTYSVGQVVKAVSADLEQGKTSPPPRYTQDTLITDMENAWKFGKTPDERAMLKQTEGIGTARTREPTLANLLRRELILTRKVGKMHEIKSSDLGRGMIGRLPAWLTDVGTTAKWETLLGAIEKGDADPQAVLDSQIAYVNQIVERAKGQMPQKALKA